MGIVSATVGDDSTFIPLSKSGRVFAVAVARRLAGLVGPSSDGYEGSRFLVKESGTRSVPLGVFARVEKSQSEKARSQIEAATWTDRQEPSRVTVPRWSCRTLLIFRSGEALGNPERKVAE